jgi:hypothetical protein
MGRDLPDGQISGRSLTQWTLGDRCLILASRIAAALNGNGYEIISGPSRTSAREKSGHEGVIDAASPMRESMTKMQLSPITTRRSR